MLYPDIKNLLIDMTLEQVLLNFEAEEDDVDSMIPGVRDKLILLPVVKTEKEKKQIIKINLEETKEIEMSETTNEPI